MARTGSPRAAVARNTRTETSHRLRTARPIRRSSQMTQAAAPERPRGGATSSSGSWSIATSVMSDRHLVELVVAEREVLARLETLHAGAVRVDMLAEAPDDQAALVVLDLLRLVEQVGPLRLVELGRGLVDQVPVLRVVPVRLVVGATELLGEGADDGLRDVVAGVPEVLGERVGQVVVVVERRLLGDLDLDAGLLGLLGEEVRGRNGHGADAVAGEQLDLEPLLAGLLEQRLGLIDVPLALGQVARVGHVERCVEVVAQR